MKKKIIIQFSVRRVERLALKMHWKRPELFKSSFHKPYAERLILLNFGKKNMKMIIFIIRTFELSDIDQGIFKLAIQKK